MTQLSPLCRARANKNAAVVLSAFAEKAQTVVAQEMGWQDDKISRLKSGEKLIGFQAFCDLLAICDLKVVPTAYRCFDQAKAQALMTLYKAAMARIADPIDLLLGDDDET